MQLLVLNQLPFNILVFGLYRLALVVGGLQGDFPAELSLVVPKMHKLLAKAGPIRNGGNASVITDLRGKKTPVFVQLYLQPEQSRVRT